MSKYLITTLFCVLTNFCQAQALEDDVYYYSFWEFQPQDTSYVFIDQAKIRSTPKLDGQLLDSLTSSTPITILERINNQTYLKGLHAPWYKISYKKTTKHQLVIFGEACWHYKQKKPTKKKICF